MANMAEIPVKGPSRNSLVLYSTVSVSAFPAFYQQFPEKLKCLIVKCQIMELESNMKDKL